MTTKRRVVITGFGALSPIGNDEASIVNSLRTGKSGVRHMSHWNEYPDLHTRVGGVVEGIDEKVIPREFRRSMARAALLATLASKQAVESAQLTPALLQNGRTGLSIGQTVASPSAMEVFFDTFRKDGPRGIKSTTFLQMMSHSAVANVALYLGCKGRTWAPASACASSTQAIGLAYENIRDGSQDVMLCGGSEELHVTTAVVFDIVQGTSRKFNNQPHLTPKPFDRDRDGLVVAEGAGIVVLEELEHALQRRASIWGELVGYATSCDGEHISSPSKRGMAACMQWALQDAKLNAEAIQYVNAHATGTPAGDGVEAEATFEVVGSTPWVSSTKGHTGHTLAACGALEVIYSLLMMKHEFIAPTLNLINPEPACSGLRMAMQPQNASIRYALSNNFAFGGVNASLVLGSPTVVSQRG